MSRKAEIVPKAKQIAIRTVMIVMKMLKPVSIVNI